MEKLNRMVIDLYKEALSSENYRVNPDSSLNALVEIRKAITTATIKGMPTDELCKLEEDVKLLREAI